ncbi:l-allo-threonine aldolase [Stipitochalara longipes BDJ]|nr:l-allo-threonine aldolase [Stipitochalara longipes BDJ]
MASRIRLLKRALLHSFHLHKSQPATWKALQSQSLRAQSTQTAVLPLLKKERHSEKNTLDDVFSLLRSTSIAWNQPGPAEFDFRSDVVTTPTLSILRAILETTLQDDVYQEDPTTSALESHMANLTGNEAGIFVLSGTMANQVALRTHLTQPPHAVLCDARSHVIHWEAGGLASLCGAMVQGVVPSNGEFLTLEDIQRKAVLSNDVHKCPTTVISLENTISGIVHPLSELQRISNWAHKNELKVHIDGARLWEAVATGAGSLRDFAQCADSISLDFSKGLGAPMGAIVVGSGKFVDRARRIRKSIGGGMRQAGVLSSAARAAVDETFGPGVWGLNLGGKLRGVHDTARKVAEMWVRRGGRLRRRTETNLVWVELGYAGISDEDFAGIGRSFGVKLDGSRIVLHHQISEEALRRLGLVFDTVLSTRLFV